MAWSVDLLQLIKWAEREFKHRGLVTVVNNSLDSEVSYCMNEAGRDIYLLLEQPKVALSKTKNIANEPQGTLANLTSHYVDDQRHAGRANLNC